MRLVVNHYFIENSIFKDVSNALVEVQREEHDMTKLCYVVRVVEYGSSRCPRCVIATSDIEKAFKLCDQINDAISSGQEVLEVSS